jgi:hypothetical protein
MSTKGRDIVNSRGEVVKWAGVNWPGSGMHIVAQLDSYSVSDKAAGETMIPEGLEFKSVEELVSDIADVGFNFIRL